MGDISKKLLGLFLGISLSLGVGAGLGSVHKEASEVRAANDISSYTLLTTTTLSTLTTNDTVVITTKDGSTGVTGYSSKDATVSASLADWLTFTVTNVDASAGTYSLKDSSAGKWITLSSGNQFTINSTSQTNLTADADGYFKYTSGTKTRYLAKNSTNYRCYDGNSSTSYTYFYVYIVPSDVLKLNSISVKSATAEYYEGTCFDTTGLVITENFSDESTKDIEYSETTKGNFTFAPKLDVILSTDVKKINIAYKDEIYGTKDVDFPITVKEDNVTSISIDESSSFEGKTFAYNGSWSTNGIIVKATRVSGATTILDNDDENLTFKFNPEKPNSYDLTSANVTVSYKGIDETVSTTLSGFNIIDQIECTFDFVTNFETYAKDWSSSYSKYTLTNDDLSAELEASITLDVTSKQTSTIKDRPVFKGSVNNVIIDFSIPSKEYKIKYVEVVFAQWSNKTPTLSLYDGKYSSTATAIASLTISSTTLVLSGSIDNTQFQITTSGSNQVGLTSIKVAAVKDTSAIFEHAVEYSSLFNEYIGCDPDGVKEPSGWGEVKELWDSYSSNTHEYFKNADPATETNEDIVKCINTYEYIIKKYNSKDPDKYNNFMGREVLVTNASNSIYRTSDNNTPILIVVLVAFTSVTAIGGYFFLRKRKIQ